MAENPTSLREKKKAETRNGILNAARDLFGERGFDGTTLDDICEATRISRRTFFRYFPSKEALVFPNREARLERFRAFMAHPREGDSVFATLRRGTKIFAREYEHNRASILAMQAVIHESTALLAREREIDREWERVMEDAFSREAGDTPQARRRARILAGATIGVVRATMRDWFERDGDDDLAELGLAALESLERGFPRAE
jgi:AcrR family transcriptional regulator